MFDVVRKILTAIPFAHLVRKLVLAVPLVIGVITLTFLLVELSPGDAADRFFTPETPPEVRQAIEKKWGLDRPASERYLIMLRNLATGDFGRSISQDRPVFEMVAEALPNTILLSVVTLIIIQVVGLSLGIVQAVRQYSLADSLLSVGSLTLYSMPQFWLALMLQLLFTLKWQLLPSSGMTDPIMYDYMSFTEKIVDRLAHLLLPGIALAVASSAGVARYMRSSVLEVIRQDYIRTAHAKGLPERTVILKHAVRNAMLPVITIIGLQLPFLFSGTVLVETIFAWPGMGRLIVSAIFEQDTPVIIGCFFVISVLVLAGNVIADLLYAMVDPRIRYS